MQVTIVARRPDDELLLLASDGLWDVLSNQEAVTLAKRCLRRALQRGASRQSAARIAATVLTRAAFDRGSRHASLDWLLSLDRTTTSRECWARAQHKQTTCSTLPSLVLLLLHILQLQVSIYDVHACGARTHCHHHQPSTGSHASPAGKMHLSVHVGVYRWSTGLRSW